MPTSVVDMLVVPNRGIGETDGDALYWYCKNAVTISNEVQVGSPICWDIGKVMDACQPRGYEFKPYRQFGCYYALVRAVSEEAHWESWDWDGALKRTLAMSRLVHPNPAAFHYCARVRRNADGAIMSIEPQQIWGSAFGGDPAREWLKPTEWAEVARLLERWPLSHAQSVERILRAMWYREMYAQEKYREVRWPLLGCAIESLVGQWNGNKNSGPVFKEGLCKLARNCDLHLDAESAKEAWNMRSHGAHGQDIPAPESVGPTEFVGDDGLFRKVEQVLGATLVNAIHDDCFASRFDD